MSRGYEKAHFKNGHESVLEDITDPDGTHHRRALFVVLHSLYFNIIKANRNVKQKASIFYWPGLFITLGVRNNPKKLLF